MKSYSSLTVIADEEAIREEEGHFTIIDGNSLSREDFITKFLLNVSDRKHRDQALQYCASLSVSTVLFVHACLSSIIRVVCITFNPAMLEDYIATFDQLKDAHLRWVWPTDDGFGLAAPPLIIYGYLVDDHTVQQKLSLFRILRRKVIGNGPFKEGSCSIIPKEIYLHNKNKVGEDLTGQILLANKPKHSRIHPKANQTLTLYWQIVFNIKSNCSAASWQSDH